jgi:hypothetical protein
MNWRTIPKLARVLARNIRRGQINFIRGIMNYKKVYNVEKMLADHARPVRYQLPTRACSDSKTCTLRRQAGINTFAAEKKISRRRAPMLDMPRERKCRIANIAFNDAMILPHERIQAGRHFRKGQLPMLASEWLI